MLYGPTNEEMITDIFKGDGGDPGAPVDPKLKRKFITTTWVSALVFVAVWLIIRSGVVKLPSLPSTY
jgi:predicted secreted protein